MLPGLIPRYVNTSDNEIPEYSIIIPDQDHLDTKVAKLLNSRNSPDKIDLAGKISTKDWQRTKSKALIHLHIWQLL